MSDLRRFFVKEITEPLVIDGEEYRHAVSVLRIKEREEIIVCDNSGTEYLANIEKINKKDFVAHIYDKRQSTTESKNSVTLIAGYLKGDKTELVVQKAVELGVKKIVVLSSLLIFLIHGAKHIPRCAYRHSLLGIFLHFLRGYNLLSKLIELYAALESEKGP